MEQPSRKFKLGDIAFLWDDRLVTVIEVSVKPRWYRVRCHATGETFSCTEGSLSKVNSGYGKLWRELCE
jgi:hypothetical protein